VTDHELDGLASALDDFLQPYEFCCGYTQTFGKDEPPGCYEDIDHADCFFLMGANPFECHPPIFERIQQRRRAHPGTQVVRVDPRPTETAKRSDIHLPVVPGTDLLLLNAMAHVICAEGLTDDAFIGEHVRFSDGTTTVTFDEFRRFLGDYAPEKVADRGRKGGDLNWFAQPSGRQPLRTRNEQAGRRMIARAPHDMRQLQRADQIA
jgi:anaerobic selenocysteine-containing dehydrogenase